jgi:hypothetical protein
MMKSRGMGAISPSKMPKKKVIERTDDPNKVAMYKRGGTVKKFKDGEIVEDDSSELVKKARALIAQNEREEMRPNPATGQFPVPDLSYVKDNVMVAPRYLYLDKDAQGVGGRLMATKKLGKDAMLQAYLDADVSRDDQQGVRGKASGAGINFIKNFAKGGKVGLYANINAKRKRIAEGSGEKMRKPGAKGAPTADAFVQSAKTAKVK